MEKGKQHRQNKNGNIKKIKNTYNYIKSKSIKKINKN